MKKLILMVSLCLAILESSGQCSTNQPNIAVSSSGFSTIIVVQGESMTLTAPTLTASSYQWLKDGVNIPGETNATFTIANFMSSDVASYGVVIDGTTLGNSVFVGIFIPSLPGRTADSLALVDLYNSTDGPSWTNNTNWLSGPLESWHGITTFNCRVTEVTLQSNDMVGPIPSSFTDLSELQRLDVRENSISGVLDLSAMTALRICIAFNNNFSDFTLGTHPLLRYFHLYGNPITPGKIVDLTGMNQLYDLRIHGLGLDGVIFSGTYNNLAFLLIQDNNISGTLDISVMPSLIHCFAHNNAYTDFNMGVNADLTRFYMYGNPIAPGKSIDITTMTKMLDFRVQGLGMDKIVMNGVYSQFLYLLIQDNNLSGTLDTRNMPALQLCYAFDNAYTDFELGTNPELQRFYMYNNPVMPGKTIDISTMTKLIDFRINGLGIAKMIMTGIYPNLLYFNVHNNDIVGTLDLSQAPLLKTCAAQNNEFENLLLHPSVLGPARELSTLNVSNNRLQFDDLLPYNSLFGVIPFSYVPQQDVPTLLISSSTVRVDVGGAGNNYLWDPTGATVNPYLVPASGTYFCEVTNPGVPGLTISSNPITVTLPPAARMSAVEQQIASAEKETISLNGQEHQPYPNPVRLGEPIHVKLDLSEKEDLSITLYSGNGQLVKTYTQQGYKGIHTYQVSSSELRQGLYTIHFKYGDQQVIHKVIIQ